MCRTLLFILKRWKVMSWGNSIVKVIPLLNEVATVIKDYRFLVIYINACNHILKNNNIMMKEDRVKMIQAIISNLLTSKIKIQPKFIKIVKQMIKT